jgi:hypothetical protein
MAVFKPWELGIGNWKFGFKPKASPKMGQFGVLVSRVKCLNTQKGLPSLS